MAKETKTKWYFWYSAKQEAVAKELAPFYSPPQRYIECYFKGKPFTERTQSNKPFGNWDDFIFLGTGTESDIRYE